MSEQSGGGPITHPILAALDNYDWAEAFGYVGEPDTCATRYQGASGLPTLVEGAVCSADPFAREDVVHVYGASPGENDGAEWMCIGRLRDGRYFYLEAGCNYTGWDCHANGSGWVSHSLDHLRQFGVTSRARDRFPDMDDWTESVEVSHG